MGNDFKVVYSKKSLIPFLSFFSIIAIVLIYSAINIKETIYLITTICFFLIGFYVVFVTLVFSVKVNGNNIIFITRLGLKYSFDVSEIEKVVCSRNYSPKQTATHCIEIKIKSKSFTIQNDMLNFGKLAGYLTEKYEIGEINSEAMSDNCQKQLIRHKNKLNKSKKQDEH